MSDARLRWFSDLRSHREFEHLDGRYFWEIATDPVSIKFGEQFGLAGPAAKLGRLRDDTPPEALPAFSYLVCLSITSGGVWASNGRAIAGETVEVRAVQRAQDCGPYPTPPVYDVHIRRFIPAPLNMAHTEEVNAIVTLRKMIDRLSGEAHDWGTSLFTFEVLPTAEGLVLHCKVFAKGQDIPHKLRLFVNPNGHVVSIDALSPTDRRAVADAIAKAGPPQDGHFLYWMGRTRAQIDDEYTAERPADDPSAAGGETNAPA